jgi:hypothetical protein
VIDDEVALLDVLDTAGQEEYGCVLADFLVMFTRILHLPSRLAGLQCFMSVHVLILVAKELHHTGPCENSTCVLAKASFWCIP